MYHLIALLIGFFVDLLLGDPHSIPHPVVWIGKLISAAEKLVRRLFPKTVRGENIAGGVLWVIVVLVSTAVPALLLYAAYRLHPAAGLVLESIMCWQILATRSLRDESMKVYAALQTGSLSDAQRAVSMIVGRDTERLDEKGVARAAVETVAENGRARGVPPRRFDDRRARYRGAGRSGRNARRGGDRGGERFRRRHRADALSRARRRAARLFL